LYWKENDSAALVEAHEAHGGEGTIRLNPLFQHVSKLSVNISVLELEPGVSEGNHTHEDDDALEEIYYFTEGQGVVSVDGRDVPVAAGEAVLAPAGTEHGIRNTGKGPMKVVFIWGRPKG